MTKVPADPNMSSEVRSFLDDRARAETKLQSDVADALAAIPALASEAEAEAGTDNVNYMSALRVAEAIAALGAFGRVIHVQDQKSSGTDGGTFTSGSFQTRTLNTVVLNTVTGASLASDQVTLPAGVYYARGTAPGNRVQNHRLQLYNITGSATLLLGGNINNPPVSTSENSIRADVQGVFTLAVTSAIELQHRGQNTVNTNGFGPAQSFGINEVYADLLIARIA